MDARGGKQCGERIRLRRAAPIADEGVARAGMYPVFREIGG